jgi:hypothetical protein
MGFNADASAENTTTSASGARTNITFEPAFKSTTGVTVHGVNANIVGIVNYTNGMVWMVDGSGDVYYAGSDDNTLSDDYDDVKMLTALRGHLSSLPDVKARFGDWIREYTPALIGAGVLGEDGTMVSTKGLNGLLIDTHRQQAEDLMSIVSVLAPDQREALSPRIQRRLELAGA